MGDTVPSGARLPAQYHVEERLDLPLGGDPGIRQHGRGGKGLGDDSGPRRLDAGGLYPGRPKGRRKVRQIAQST